MSIVGKVWKYGDNVDTDAIIPARYLNTTSEEELATHCMEDIDPGFATSVGTGDLIVAGKNFGCGSSREHAPLAIRAAGVGCVVAETFARIFFRNAINIGLPILECPEAVRDAAAGHTLEIDLAQGLIRNRDLGTEYHADAYPPFMLELIQAGGLVTYTRNKIGTAAPTGAANE